MRYYPQFPKAIPRQKADSYALLTRPPLVSTPKGLLPFDLHVLSMPPAFNLSQDQTLKKNLTLKWPKPLSYILLDPSTTLS